MAGDAAVIPRPDAKGHPAGAEKGYALLPPLAMEDAAGQGQRSVYPVLPLVVVFLSSYSVKWKVTAQRKACTGLADQDDGKQNKTSEEQQGGGVDSHEAFHAAS